MFVYRAYTIQLKDTNTVTVFLCDYGSYRDIDIINVVPLQTKFYELPYQAIYAELYGKLILLESTNLWY